MKKNLIKIIVIAAIVIVVVVIVAFVIKVSNGVSAFEEWKKNYTPPYSYSK